MKLSELESAVLGVIGRRGPCSAYAVQKNFELVSASWSASPGSVYPLVQRLHRLGLLAVRKSPRGTRELSLYTITRKGERRVAAWVVDLPEWAGRAAADPIRTRTFFIDVLNGAEQRNLFLDRAEAVTRTALERLEKGIASAIDEKDRNERLAQLGGILQLKARLEWIALLRDHYAHGSSSRPGKDSDIKRSSRVSSNRG